MPPTLKRPFRFIHTGASKGSVNMAMDEAVFTGLREGQSTPVLRLYTWLPATISIGYFQNAEEQEDRIEELALRVIEIATKIKTKDIT